MDDSESKFYDLAVLAIENALESLLGEKHLYQSVVVSAAEIQAEVERLVAENEALAAEYSSDPEVQQMGVAAVLESEGQDYKEFQEGIGTAKWTIQNVSSAQTRGQDRCRGGNPRFSAPRIYAYCIKCHARWPFKCDYGHSPQLSPQQFDLVTGSGKARQLFVIPYRCTSCSSYTIVFMVARSGLKLTLCGRSEVEVMPVPLFLPQAQRRYFSDAIIAHHAGQTLAGLFLLRTFIEQFWRSILTDLPPEKRYSGEELGAAYNRTLPDDFKRRFPSLPDLYADLSAALHEARPDSELFEGVRSKLEKHFDSRRVFEL